MKTIGGLESCFHNAVMQETKSTGDGVAVSGGYPVPGGDKETPGRIETANVASVTSAPAVGGHVTVGDAIARPKGTGMGQV